MYTSRNSVAFTASRLNICNAVITYACKQGSCQQTTLAMLETSLVLRNPNQLIILLMRISVTLPSEAIEASDGNFWTWLQSMLCRCSLHNSCERHVLAVQGGYFEPKKAV